MTGRGAVLSLLLSALIVSGCESIGDTLSLSREPLTLQQQANLAVGMDYQTALSAIIAGGKKRIAQTSASSALDPNSSDALQLPPAPAGNSFGPRIGQYFLADDFVVYRHALPQAVAQAGPVIDAAAGEPVPNDSDAAIAPTQVRLTYFLVSPSSVVTDYATATLNVATTACLQIISGSVVICDEPDRLSADFEFFDSAVRTSDLQGLSSWNVSANANIAVDAQNAPVPAGKPLQ